MDPAVTAHFAAAEARASAACAALRDAAAARLPGLLVTTAAKWAGTPAFRIWLPGTPVGVHVSVPLHLPPPHAAQLTLARARRPVTDRTRRDGTETFACVFDPAWGYRDHRYAADAAGVVAEVAHVVTAWNAARAPPVDEEEL